MTSEQPERMSATDFAEALNAAIIDPRDQNIEDIFSQATALPERMIALNRALPRILRSAIFGDHTTPDTCGRILRLAKTKDLFNRAVANALPGLLEKILSSDAPYSAHKILLIGSIIEYSAKSDFSRTEWIDPMDKAVAETIPAMLQTIADAGRPQGRRLFYTIMSAAQASTLMEKAVGQGLTAIYDEAADRGSTNPALPPMDHLLDKSYGGWPAGYRVAINTVLARLDARWAAEDARRAAEEPPFPGASGPNI